VTKDLARSRQREHSKLSKDQKRQAFGNDKENRGGDHKEEREDWLNRSMRYTGENTLANRQDRRTCTVEYPDADTSDIAGMNHRPINIPIPSGGGRHQRSQTR
jgi:hypothetical protein